MNPNRQKVLDATLQLLAQSGLSGAGLNDVIALSGASRGSLYHFFPGGKQQWVAEALQIYADSFAQGCETAISTAPTVSQRIANVFLFAAKMMKTRNFQSGCPVGAVALDLDDDSEHLRSLCLDIMAQWQHQLAAHLTPLPKAKALALAKMVIACFEGAFMLARLERSTAPLTLAAEQMTTLLEAHIEAVSEGSLPDHARRDCPVSGANDAAGPIGLVQEGRSNRRWRQTGRRR
ncbi:TetR family transcriptional regulator C-terminal domain-containing protein [Rhodoferax sp.]|jgi:TetR/AcrR family transcriptional repressor of lmrAB and yxaGH operons|uniref:TetR/AcrR family transcriptional regulator n=1 Tax=Rhodoferax sp. TaxID=50421 RepID=UPI003783FC8B